MPLQEIDNFSISYLQILDEHGNLDDELEPQLSDDELVRVYRSMVLAREADKRMLMLQRQGRIGTFAPCTGQEAAVCGPTLAMTKKDWFVCSFREMPGRLMRGETLLQVFLFYNGYEEGNTMPPSSRTLPIAIPVSSQIPHAVGIAYAMKYRGEKDSAAVVFFGDGGTSQGDFHEALNFASLWQAPVVFICQNNHWAISIPRNKQSRSKTLAQKAIAYDMPGIQVDGNDVLAMYKATREALDRAHAGDGPTLIEAVTYRLSMHTTADDPKKYRPEEEVQEWWKRDPVPRFRLYLERKNIWNAALQEDMETEIKSEVDAAVKEFEQITDFKPDAPFDYIFGSEHAEIEEQRAEFLAASEARLLNKEAADA
ncbi:MAG: pyruvate dehydrogenase (acetyl-transferring) E1 component subunit alpha [Deltaproteobacteria bacterium]|nr:MAG: pyruvate dehydrogenase (acetyl-transferring) E1 component subunit alpha [Deltaproteobacteria bacterium]